MSTCYLVRTSFKIPTPHWKVPLVRPLYRMFNWRLDPGRRQIFGSGLMGKIPFFVFVLTLNTISVSPFVLQIMQHLSSKMLCPAGNVNYTCTKYCKRFPFLIPVEPRFSRKAGDRLCRIRSKLLVCYVRLIYNPYCNSTLVLNSHVDVWALKATCSEFSCNKPWKQRNQVLNWACVLGPVPSSWRTKVRNFL